MLDWKHLYPFKSHELELNGEKMHYLDEGTGPTLLMVHGNPTWSFYWRNLILALRDQYRVIAVDHIGCGLSSKPDTGSYHFTLDQRIKDLTSFIKHLELSEITLVAHDWGGAIGMGTAVRNPERFSRFILCNTASFRFGWCPLRIRVCRTPVLGKILLKGLNLFSRMAVKMAVAKPERMNSEIRSGLLSPYNSWHNRTAVYEFVRDIPLSSWHPSYKTLCEVETGLEQFKDYPVCLIWGMRDWCFHEQFLKRYQEYFPKALVTRLSDAGHYVVEDAYERMIPVIKSFISSDAPPPEE